MDKLDVAIIRQLTQSGMILASRPGLTPSHRQLSKQLRVPLGTVRNRINGMYKSGVLKGSIVYPNPNLFNLRAAAYTLDIPHSLNRAEAFKRLKLVDGVLSGHNFIGSRAWIVFFYRDQRELNEKLLRFKKISGTDGVQSAIPFPPCPVSLTRADALLISELSRNGLVSYGELGRKLGVSVRTVKRRMAKIVGENMILSLPNVDYNALAGLVPVDVMIFFENKAEVRAEAEKKVLEIVGDYVILAALFDFVGMCSLLLPKVAQMSQLAEKVKQIEGVREVWVEIVEEHMHQGQILIDYLPKEIARP